MDETQKRTFEHVIRERWCKGCGVCVAFCPKKVLNLKNGKVYAEKPELCIGCRLCELRCPDFAIEIQDNRKEEKDGTNSSGHDNKIPGGCA